MAPSWLQIVLVLLVIVLLFGRGKISEVMGDFAKGIKSFKKGLNEEQEEKKAEETKSIEGTTANKVDTNTSSHENMRAG